MMASSMTMQFAYKVTSVETIQIVHEPNLARCSNTIDHAYSPAAACGRNPRQCCMIWLGSSYSLAATAPLRPPANIASSLERETDRINCAMNEKSKCSGNGEANRRKGESRASSPFPLGGFSALPRTGGIPQPLEARPYGQTMPAHLRVQHLDLTVRRQQALIHRISLRMEPQHLSLNLFQMAPREVALASRESKREQATRPWLNLKYASQMESLCPESVILRPAAACDWSPRQRRLIWVGAAYRLAVAALLPPLTYVALSLGYELDRVVQELDNQGYQTQESIQPVHRQFTSSQGRRRCRLTGLTPLTYRYYSRLEAILQTCVRYCSRARPPFEHRPPASRCLTPYTKNAGKGHSATVWRGVIERFAKSDSRVFKTCSSISRAGSPDLPQSSNQACSHIQNERPLHTRRAERSLPSRFIAANRYEQQSKGHLPWLSGYQKSK